MNEDDLQKLILDVKEGLIDKDEFIADLIKLIERCPYRYKLSTFRATDLHDFLLDSIKTFRALIDSYDERKGSFSNYLGHALLFYGKNWKRADLKRNIKEKFNLEISRFTQEEILASYAELDNYTQTDCYYEADDLIELVAEKTVSYTADAIVKVPDCDVYDITDWRPINKLNLHDEARIVDTGIKALVVSLLRACNDLTEDILYNITDAVGISFDLLKKYIDELSLTLKRKSVAREKHKRARDNAFYSKFEYSTRFRRLEYSGCDDFFRKLISSRFSKKYATWKNNTDLLNADSKLKVAPTFREIADVLHTTINIVRYYDDKALKSSVISEMLKIRQKRLKAKKNKK
ncbi:MAG: hypothetical protein K6F69_01935 [Treponema sp.]|nr:hypothetical protein [Treponema sp.]